MADSPGANSAATLNGLFKETYADKMERLIPDGKKILERVKFISKEKQPGNAYHQPVVLAMEHGVTYADPTEGAFALEVPVAGQIQDAVVKGYQLLLRSAMSYAQAARSAGPGERAFEEATKYLVGSMMDSVTKRLEIECLYGQDELSVVNSITGSVVTLEAAEFAPGIWSGANGMPIDIFDVTLTTLRATVAIVSADLTNRTITLGTPTVGSIGTIVATDRILAKGAKGKEFAGIHAILNNNTTMFGIDASVYDLWKGSRFAPAATSVLSFAILQQAISKGVEKGLDRDVTVLVNPGHWDDLLTEQAALRMYDSSYSSADAENGSKSIKFHSQNGMVEIVPSIYVKEGFAYVLCVEDWVRIGSTDVTFKRPGQGDEFFRDLDGFAGYELRCYTDQAIFCARPGRSILISNLKVS